ncbi:MAG TPA: AAA family ATPase [Acidimicrobiia bacterium]|nr:AAA family ATPase [Acidimicrobiia bacterium]
MGDIAAAVCHSCGAEVGASDRFCRVCGTALSTPCRHCGAAVAAGAAVCLECGTPVPGAAVRPVEHRLVTALYVDLVGSTSLAERLDPENFARVVGLLHEAVRVEVERREGIVGAFIGDGVLGVFGLPAAHEDDPERALRAAQAIQRRFEAVNRDVGARFDVTLAARIGVSTGDLLAPTAGTLDLGTLAGDVLNVAARLQEVARPGQVVVSERTARSALSFRFEDLGVVDVRGRARPLHVFRLAGAGERRSVATQGPFLGREDAIAELRTSFNKVVAEGRPAHVLVLGDPGVGKSRLVREFVDWAPGVDPSLTILTGRCLPYGQDVVYRPLAEILTDLTGITATTESSEARRMVEQVLPTEGIEDRDAAVDALLGMLGLGPEGAISPRRIRELLREAWRNLLSGLADDGPVLLVIEDVHWAGDALLDVLDYIVRRVEGPLLLLTPSRPEVFDRRPAWHTEESRTRVVTVTPLDPDQARRLAGRLLAEARLPVTESDAVAARADGNPFFMEELVRQLALRRSDAVHDHTVELPATIQGVIAARIDLLRPRERRVLQAASVMGRIFWPKAVAHLTGLEPGEVDVALRRLESLQMVRRNLRSSLGDELEYLFQHSLISETAYGRLARADLARMHGALAEWLERRDPSERREGAERLAYHTARAHAAAEAIGGFTEDEVTRLRRLAVDRLLAAARLARERGAFGRSVEMATQALAIAAGPGETWRVHEQLGLTHMAEYDGDAAWAALVTAVDLHMKSGAVDGPTVARLAAAAVASPLRWTGTMHQMPELGEVMRVLHLGLEHAGKEDSEPLASLLTAVAFLPVSPYARDGAGMDRDDAHAAGQRAREMAHRLGLPHAELAALDALMSHALNTGRIQQAAAIVEERLELAEAVSDPWEVGDTYAMAAWLSFDLGDYEVARDRAARGYARTCDDAPGVALHTLSWGAVARVQTGEWDDVVAALRTARQLLDADRRDRPPIYAAPLYAAAAMVAEFRGKPAEADRLLAILTDTWASSDLAQVTPHPHASWSRHTGPIYLRRGKLDVVAELIVPTNSRRIGQEADRLALRCEWVAARRAWEEADGAIADTLATANAYGMKALHAHADRLEGRASLAAGDRTGARALLGAARDRFAALGDHWEAARTTLDLAAAAGDVDLPGALATFTVAGAVDEIAAVQRLLAATRR